MLTAECSEKRASVDKDNGNSNFANPKAFYNKEQSACRMLKTFLGKIRFYLAEVLLVRF